MLIYTRAFDASKGQVITSSQELDVTFKSSVNTKADLPMDDADNTVRYAYDNNHLYCKVNGTWLDQGVFDLSDMIVERTTQQLS